jgi:hypothetical protein
VRDADLGAETLEGGRDRVKAGADGGEGGREVGRRGGNEEEGGVMGGYLHEGEQKLCQLVGLIERKKGKGDATNLGLELPSDFIDPIAQPRNRHFCTHIPSSSSSFPSRNTQRLGSFLNSTRL